MPKKPGALGDDPFPTRRNLKPFPYSRTAQRAINQGPAEALEELPNGIHSGLRREKCNGMFFYFQAPRADGQGRRHLWRYVGAGTRDVVENRFEIARLIACPPEEPRYVGQQDVFVLQDKAIDHVLPAEREAEARAAAPTTVGPIQQTVTETVKECIRRRTVDRDKAKTCLSFLGQPMGKALHARLGALYEGWGAKKDDKELVEAIHTMSEQFGKEKSSRGPTRRLTREDLELICYEYLSC